jgi:hypothetical protein
LTADLAEAAPSKAQAWESPLEEADALAVFHTAQNRRMPGHVAGTSMEARSRIINVIVSGAEKGVERSCSSAMRGLCSVAP